MSIKTSPTLIADDVRIYTVREVAEIIKTNEDYVRKLISQGYLRAIRLGSVKITHRSLAEFLVANDGCDMGGRNGPASVVRLEEVQIA